MNARVGAKEAAELGQVGALSPPSASSQEGLSLLDADYQNPTCQRHQHPPDFSLRRR